MPTDPTQYQPYTPGTPPAYDPPQPYPYGPPQGYAPQGYAQPTYGAPMARATSGWAIASLVSSLVGFFLVPLIGSILGIIFGHISLGEIKRSEGALDGHGMALAGLIIGYVSIGLILLVVLFVVLIIGLSVAAAPSSFAPGFPV